MSVDRRPRAQRSSPGEAGGAAAGRVDEVGRRGFELVKRIHGAVERLSLPETSDVYTVAREVFGLPIEYVDDPDTVAYVRREKDGSVKLGIGPGLARVDDRELAGVVLHEALHAFLDHVDPQVMRGKNPLLWNIATDVYINTVLRNSGVRLPKGALHPEQFGLTDKDVFRMTAEGVYNHIRKQLEQANKEIERVVRSYEQGGHKKGATGRDFDIEGEEEESAEDRGEGKKRGKAGGGEGRERQGEGKGEGREEEMEEGREEERERGTSGGEEKTEEEREGRERKKWERREYRVGGKSRELSKEAAKGYARDMIRRAARNAGLGMSEIEQLLEAEDAAYRWETLLKSVIEWYIGSAVTTWRKLNRRLGEELPGYVRLMPPRIHAFVDVSGSVQNELLSKFYGVLRDISAEHNVEVLIYQWADGLVTGPDGAPLIDVIDPHEARASGEKFEFTRKAVGGTVLSPALRYAIDEGLVKPDDVVIVASDFVLMDSGEAAEILREHASTGKVVLVVPFELVANAIGLGVDGADIVPFR